MGHVGHMKDIIPRNCYAKGFFTEVNGFKGKCLRKKTPKSAFSWKYAGILKTWRSWTPLKLKIIGGLLSTTFSNFDLLWSKMDFFDFLGLFSKSFSLETIDFCEKSFYTAVSRYNISHMTPMTHTFEKKEQPYRVIGL